MQNHPRNERGLSGIHTGFYADKIIPIKRNERLNLLRRRLNPDNMPHKPQTVIQKMLNQFSEPFIKLLRQCCSPALTILSFPKYLSGIRFSPTFTSSLSLFSFKA